jgi:hypothetical protein
MKEKRQGFLVREDVVRCLSSAKMRMMLNECLGAVLHTLQAALMQALRHVAPAFSETKTIKQPHYSSCLKASNVRKDLNMFPTE